MALYNFILFWFCISFLLMREWKYIIYGIIGLIVINLFYLLMIESNNIIHTAIYAFIAVSIIFPFFGAVGIIISAYHVYSSPALQAEMRSRTFVPSQASHKYFGSVSRLR